MKRVTLSIAVLLVLGATASAQDFPLKGTRLRLVPQLTAPCVSGQACLWYDSVAAAYKLTNPADGTNTGALTLGSLTLTSTLATSGAAVGVTKFGIVSSDATDVEYHSFTPTTAGAKAWHCYFGEFSSGDIAEPDEVQRCGWNLGPGGQRLDLTKPSMSDTRESHFLQAGQLQMEWWKSFEGTNGVNTRFFEQYAKEDGTSMALNLRSHTISMLYPGDDTPVIDVSSGGPRFKSRGYGVGNTTHDYLTVNAGTFTLAVGDAGGGPTQQMTVSSSGLALLQNMSLVFLPTDSFDIGDQENRRPNAVRAKFLQIGTTSTAPTCDASARGDIWIVRGGTGVADVTEVCRKDAADAYAWHAF